MTNKNTYKLMVTIITASLLIFSIPVAASDLPVITPVVEVLDLLVDGSITPQSITTTTTYGYIQRIIFILHWQSVFVDFDKFGDDTALTNGTQIQYQGINLTNGGIKTNHEFGHITYDMSVLSDGKTPADHHLLARLTFWKFMKNELGLAMNNGQTFSIIINDNLTSGSIDLFMVTVEGFTGGEVAEDTTAQALFQEAAEINSSRILSSLPGFVTAVVFVLSTIIIIRKFR